MNRRLILSFLLTLAVLGSCREPIDYDTTPFVVPDGTIDVAFAAAADMRGYTGGDVDYFRGACERIAWGGAGDFMVSPGDIDPPADVLQTVSTYVAADYPWYPVVGNHETETTADMTWLRSYNSGGDALPNVVKVGPANCVETTYSFDRGSAHFVVLNEYCDGSTDTGTDGDVVTALYDWLAADLAATTQPVIFVFGHEAAYPQPDEDNGRLRHQTDSLNAHAATRDAFWALLESWGVTAYVCGHTHNYSAYKQGTVWQIDVGHARGYGDTGARSTFVMFYVMDNGDVWIHPYRLDLDTHNYVLTTARQIR